VELSPTEHARPCPCIHTFLLAAETKTRLGCLTLSSGERFNGPANDVEKVLRRWGLSELRQGLRAYM
jgi:hypothetical protein